MRTLIRISLPVIILISIVILSLQHVDLIEVYRQNVKDFINWKNVKDFINWTSITGIATILSTLAAVIGLLFAHRSNQIRIALKGTAAEPSFVEEREEETRPLSYNASIENYLKSLAEMLRESILKEQFVKLDVVEQEELTELPQSFERRHRGLASPINLFDAHAKFVRYVLLGEPGSGKTTCLKRLALHQIDCYRNEPTKTPIPVFCSLSEWKDKRKSALDFIKDSVAQRVSPNNWLLKHVDRLLELGKLLVIMDGLNEMPRRVRYRNQKREKDEQLDREDFAQDLSSGRLVPHNLDSRERSLRTLATADAVSSPFIISCRTHEFSGSFEWARIHMLPMSDDQITTFLNKYLEEEKANALSALLKNKPALQDLSRNPFYLSQLTKLADNDLNQVQTRGQFLAMLEEELMRRENIPDSKKRHFERQMSRLAFRTMNADMIGANVNLRPFRILHDDSISLGLSTGYLIEVGKDIRFRHQLVQEFFAAMALKNLQTWRSISSLVQSEKWSEVVVLWHHLSNAPDRSLRYLIRLLKQRNGLTLYPTIPLWMLPIQLTALMGYGFVTANFFIDLVTGGGFWSNLVWNHPVSILFYFIFPIFIRYMLPSLSYNRRVISNTSYILSQIHNNETNNIIVENLIRSFARIGFFRMPICKALLYIGPPSVQLLIEGLDSRNLCIRRGCIETLGLMQEPIAMENIKSILSHGDYRVYDSALISLAKSGGPEALNTLVSSLTTILPDPDLGLTWVRFAAWAPKFAEVFKSQEDTDATIVEPLVRIIDNDRTHPLARILAVHSLGMNGHPEGLSKLVEVANDKNASLRMVAIQAMVYIQSGQTVRELMSIIDNARFAGNVEEDDKGHDQALKSLAKITSKEAIPALIELLDDTRWYIHDAALASLGYVAEPDTIPKILEKLPNLSSSKLELVQCIGRIGGDDAFETLVHLARDENKAVRTEALTYLDLRFPDRSGLEMLKMLADPDYPEKVRVLTLLGNAPPPGPEFRQLLFKLRRDPDWDVRREALRILRHIDRDLSRRLKRIGVSFASKRLSGFWNWFAERTGWNEFERLLKEIELGEEDTMQSNALIQGQKAWQIARMDPDLWRKMRPILLLLGLIFLFSIALIGALPVAIYRIFSGVGGLSVTHWPYVIGIGVLTVVAYLFDLGDHRSPIIRFINGLFCTVSILAVTGLASRYVPRFVGWLSVWFYRTVIWVAERGWEYLWYAGGLVISALVLGFFLRHAQSFAGRFTRSTLWSLAVLSIFCFMVGNALEYWTITVGCFATLFLFLYMVRRRTLSKARKRRMERLKSLMEAPGASTLLEHNRVPTDSTSPAIVVEPGDYRIESRPKDSKE